MPLGPPSVFELVPNRPLYLRCQSLSVPGIEIIPFFYIFFCFPHELFHHFFSSDRSEFSLLNTQTHIQRHPLCSPPSIAPSLIIFFGWRGEEKGRGVCRSTKETAGNRHFLFGRWRSLDSVSGGMSGFFLRYPGFRICTESVSS